MFAKLWRDEAGAIVSIEIVLVVTIMVLGLIVGMSEVAVAVNNELNDISNAVGHLKQDYAFTGFKAQDGGKLKSFVDGSGYDDLVDDCDCNISCELVGGTTGVTGKEN